MTVQEEREKAILRIKKLLAMAEHNTSNEHEAFVAAKQAEALMRKYNIDYAEAIAQEIKSGAGMVTKDVIATAKDNGTATRKTPDWAQFLAVRVGDLFDTPVRCVWTRTNKGLEAAVRFHGYEHDVNVAAWTFEMLVATVNRVCKEYRNNPRYLEGGRTVMNSYRMGMVNGILHSLGILVAEKNQEQSTAGTALVLVKRDAITRQYGKFETRGKEISVKDLQAYRLGHAAGKEVQVRRAIN